VETLEQELLSTTEELTQATTQLKAIEDEKKARLESLNKEGAAGGGSNTEEYPLVLLFFLFSSPSSLGDVKKARGIAQ
jgi:hypothetical protein